MLGLQACRRLLAGRGRCVRATQDKARQHMARHGATATTESRRPRSQTRPGGAAHGTERHNVPGAGTQTRQEQRCPLTRISLKAPSSLRNAFANLSSWSVMLTRRCGWSTCTAGEVHAPEKCEGSFLDVQTAATLLWAGDADPQATADLLQGALRVGVCGTAVQGAAGGTAARRAGGQRPGRQVHQRWQPAPAVQLRRRSESSSSSSSGSAARKASAAP